MSKLVVTTIRLPKDLLDELKSLAIEERRTWVQLVRRYLAEYHEYQRKEMQHES